MDYIKDKMKIVTDYELRIIKEDENDTDVLIDLDRRTVNFEIDKLPKYLNSRFQFNDVKSIIIRFTKLGDNICTIHFLRSVDLHSGIVNFEVDYTEHFIEIIDKKYCVEFKITRKEENK